MKTKRIIPALLLLLMAAGCQHPGEAGEAPEPGLQITTRTNAQTYTTGDITLVINTGEAQPVELRYQYNPAVSGEWRLLAGTQPLLLNGKDYPAYAYGDVEVPWGGTGEETMPVTWIGPLTPTVSGTGTARAEIALTPATACFHLTLNGAYNEPQPLTGFSVITREVKKYATDKGATVWNLPADPYTTPRTLQLDQDAGSWELSTSPQSQPYYPAGQTIGAGKTLFELVAFTPEMQERYGTDYYTVITPAPLTLEGGKRYKYTLRLDAVSHTATIQAATIEPFATGGDPLPARNYRGIATPQDLVDFAREYNANRAATMIRWTDEGTATGTIRLLNDIDMTGRTDFERIDDFIGTFDGQGHTITGLTVATRSNTGMFYHIGTGATVKNLHLRGAEITTTGSSAGGIAFSNSGTINGCTVHGAVTGRDFAAGIALQNYGSIIACGFKGTLTGTDTYDIAYNDSPTATTTGCYYLPATGTLADTDIASMNFELYDAEHELHWIRKSAAGEVVTMPGSVQPEKCYIFTAEQLINFANDWNQGKGSQWLDAGGTVHLLADITLPDMQWPMIGYNNIYFTANFDGHGHRVRGVKASGSSYNNGFGFFFDIAGGATVKNLVVEVEVNINWMAGGIALNNDGTISGCGVHGTLTSTGSPVGGIAYSNTSTITHCYSVAKVTGAIGNSPGGIAYINSGRDVIINNCYWYKHPEGNAQLDIGYPATNIGATQCLTEQQTIESWTNAAP